MRVLLVEDDELLGNGVNTVLSQEGYAVDWLKDGKAADHALRSDTFDIIVLDLGLPRMDGLKVLQKMRDRGQSEPVLILTARDTSEDQVKGFDLGADDYLTKPFDLDVLCARLRALHRRVTSDRAQPKIEYRNIILDPASHTVYQNDEVVGMTRREFALLQKLLDNRGRALSREQLSQSLYGWEDEVDSNALEVHIHNLRKKFDENFIRTLRGIGYMVEAQ